MAPETKRAVRFVALTLLGSWAAAAFFHVAGGGWGTFASTVFAVAYMFFPFAAGAVLARFVDRRSIREALGIRFSPNRWWAVAVAIPTVLSLLALGASLLVPGVGWDAEMSGMFARFEGVLPAEQLAEMESQIDELPLHPFWLSLGQALIAGPTINALAAFGEETGWRGYLHEALRPMGFWPMAITIGAIWGVWHAPLIAMGHNYPDHPVLGIGMMILFTVGYAPLHHWVRERSGSSVAAAIMHGTVNATAGLSFMTLTESNELLVGILGGAGIATLLVANVVLAVAERDFLRRVGTTTGSSDT